MINCRQCDFLIKSNMRHALVNNCCPSCGAAILGESRTRKMRLFKQRLLQQEFAQKMSDDMVFDITLFMLLEFTTVKEPVDSEAVDKEDDNIEELEISEDTPVEEEGASSDDDYEKIRDEIRKEALEVSSVSEENLDEDLKIARLKRLAKEAKVRRPGAAVRRIGSD